MRRVLIGAGVVVGVVVGIIGIGAALTPWDSYPTGDSAANDAPTWRRP